MRPRRRFFFPAQLLMAASLLAASSSASAGQPDGGLDLSGSLPGGFSTESGKPMIGGSPEAAPAIGRPAGCAPPLPCGARLLGTVRKNGALELQMPALRW